MVCYVSDSYIMFVSVYSLCVYQQKGRTPLLSAVKEEKASVVKYLMNKGKIDVTIFDQVRLSTIKL